LEYSICSYAKTRKTEKKDSIYSMRLLHWNDDPFLANKINMHPVSIVIMEITTWPLAHIYMAPYTHKHEY
jgi:hypothetical protein